MICDIINLVLIGIGVIAIIWVLVDLKFGKGAKND